MTVFIGNIAYISIVVGVNLFLIFLLALTKWRESFISIAWTAFFFVIAVVMDMGATRILFPHTNHFILTYLRTPIYCFLAVALWVLMFAAWDKAIEGRKRRRAKQKLDIIPPTK